MDILYPIGDGSKYKDWELRFSLRSVEKHLKGFNRVFIVGRKPHWLNTNEVVYIRKEDTGRKHESIYLKIMASVSAGISDPFQFWNDDHFLLQDLNVEDLPYYYDNTIEYWAGKAQGKYKASCLNTKPGKYFDVHTPIIYTHEGLKEAFKDIDWKKDPLIKSTFAHWLGVEGEEINDIKIQGNFKADQIKAIIHKKMFFSIGPYALYHEMRKVLDELYPNKSKYEL